MALLHSPTGPMDDTEWPADVYDLTYQQVSIGMEHLTKAVEALLAAQMRFELAQRDVRYPALAQTVRRLLVRADILNELIGDTEQDRARIAQWKRRKGH